MLNLAERRKKRCVKIEKKIGAAGSFCMDQSYFRFLFRLARKSEQSGLTKSEKSLAKRNATCNRILIDYGNKYGIRLNVIFDVSKVLSLLSNDNLGKTITIISYNVLPRTSIFYDRYRRFLRENQRRLKSFIGNDFENELKQKESVCVNLRLNPLKRR